ncbi:hypothetical protein [Streptomyces sp. DH12]|uniref:hypothetical protein n=1 Tax=Streptomyces sp. DH12 TaxID=2857010 RepID=UPI001E29511A|nr:hypothetical protein [Streptomyces sp. DH12]
MSGEGGRVGDPYEVLARAAAEWDDVEPRLDAVARARLGDALRGLREGPRPWDAARDAVRVLAAALPEGAGARFVAPAVPDGPPVPDGAPGGGGPVVSGGFPAEGGPAVPGAGAGAPYSAAYAGFRAVDLAALVLDGTRMVGPVLGPVRDRLLAVPALSEDAVRERGGDPSAPGLVRLRGAGGAVRLPCFQFAGGALPWPVVPEVNRLLDADGDPWAVADWWLSGNAWLAAPPAALLGTGRDGALLGAARALVDGG